MGLSAVTGNFSNVAFTGKQPVRRNEEAWARADVLNAWARENGMTVPNSDRFERTTTGAHSNATRSAAALAALLALTAPAGQLAAQDANARLVNQAETTQTVKYSQFPSSRQPSIIVQEGQEIPNPEDYINKWVAFEDGDNYSCIFLLNNNDEKVFGAAGYFWLNAATKEFYAGAVARFNPEEGYFICKDSKGFMKMEAAGYPDAERAMVYLTEAFNSDCNNSSIVNECAH